MTIEINTKDKTIIVKDFTKLCDFLNTIKNMNIDINEYSFKIAYQIQTENMYNNLTIQYGTNPYYYTDFFRITC